VRTVRASDEQPYAEYVPKRVLRWVFVLVATVRGRVYKTVGSPNHERGIQLIRNS